MWSLESRGYFKVVFENKLWLCIVNTGIGLEKITDTILF